MEETKYFFQSFSLVYSVFFPTSGRNCPTLLFNMGFPTTSIRYLLLIMGPAKEARRPGKLTIVVLGHYCIVVTSELFTREHLCFIRSCDVSSSLPVHRMHHCSWWLGIKFLTPPVHGSRVSSSLPVFSPAKNSFHWPKVVFSSFFRFGAEETIYSRPVFSMVFSVFFSPSRRNCPTLPVRGVPFFTPVRRAPL